VRQLALRDGPGRPATQVTFSPDGRFLVVGALTQPCHVWEVGSWKEVSSPEGYGKYQRLAAFSPDGRLVASGSNDNYLRVWDFLTGRELFRAEPYPLAAVFAPDGRRLATTHRDCGILLHDVSAALRGGQAPAAALAPGDLERLWKALAGPDAPGAWQAVTRLAEAPKQSVPFLREQLRLDGPPAVEQKRLKGLIDELDHPHFAVRERAHAELARLGHGAEQALRRALKGNPSEEVRRRVERLLARLTPGPLSATYLPRSRALAALERAGTPEARELLRQAATRLDEELLRREAQAALARLAKRGEGQR
jgi:hypothetical protein